MKKYLIFFVIFFLSCTSVEKPNKSVPSQKPIHKTKTVKKPQNKTPIKANESKEEVEKMEMSDKKLGYEVDNEYKEKEELNKILDPKNEYTWLEKMWNAFKVNRAEDLLNDIENGTVYRTKESILFVIDNKYLTDSVLGELAKIYSIQKGELWIYSDVPVRQKLIQKGLDRDKIKEKFKIGDKVILRLNIGVVK